MIEKIFILYILQNSIICKMMFTNQTTCQGSNCSFAGIQGEKNHYITLTQIGATGVIDFWQDGSNLTISESIPVNVNDMPFIRSSNQNQYSSNRTLIQFASNKVIIHKNFNSSITESLNFSNFSAYTISDVCFGSSLNEIFVLANIYYGFYTILFFNGTMNFLIQKNLTVSDSLVKDDMQFQDGKIFISFQEQILVYAANSTLELIANFSLLPSSIYYIDFSVNNNTLVFSNLNELTIVNLSSLLIVSKFTHVSNITSVQFYQFCYIIFSNSTHLFQFDYQINKIIYQSPLQVSLYQKIKNIGLDSLLIFKDLTLSPYFDTKLFFYNASKDYPCVGCTSCLNTYVLDSSGNNCIKQLRNTNFSSQSDSQTAINIYNHIDQIIKEYFQSANNYFNINLLKIISVSMLASSIKISPQLLLSFCIFFDDLWFYAFHQYNYPQFVNFFLERVNIINTDKVDPWFLKLISIFNQQTSFAEENNQFMMNYLSFNSIQNQQQIYFTKSLVQNYRNNFLLQIFIFIFIWFACFLFNSFSKGSGFFHGLYKQIKRKSNWWIFSLSLFEVCLAKIVFNFGIQIQFPSFVQTVDKFNLVVSLLVFYTFILYSYVYYICIFRFLPKQRSEELLIKLKDKQNSFIYEPFLIFGKVILRSFIHGYFLKYYYLQISLLFSSDLIFIVINIRLRNYFHKKLMLLLDLLYISLFGFFDLFFFLEFSTSILGSWKRQLFGLIVISGLILISIILFLIHFICFLKNMCKKCLNICLNNKLKSQKRFNKSYKQNNSNPSGLFANKFKRRSKTQKSIFFNMKIHQKQNKRITPFLRGIDKPIKKQLKKQPKKSSLKSYSSTQSTKASLKNPSLKKTLSMNSQFEKIKREYKRSDLLMLIYNDDINI